MWTQFATSSRRLPTDSVDNLETGQTDSVAVWLREFWSILITFSTMTSLCRHFSLNSTWNCKLGHDCRRVSECVHSADTTQLDSWVASASAVCIGHTLSVFKLECNRNSNVFYYYSLGVSTKLTKMHPIVPILNTRLRPTTLFLTSTSLFSTKS